MSNEPVPERQYFFVDLGAAHIPMLCDPDCGCHQDTTGEPAGYEYSE